MTETAAVQPAVAPGGNEIPAPLPSPRRDDKERRAPRRDDKGRIARARSAGAKNAALPDNLPLRRGVAPRPATTGWTLDTFAGRMVEFSAGRSGGALTLAVKLLREAQLSGEPTAWIGRPEGSFFPPDAVVAGVDLAALPVIEPRRPLDAFRAADRLLRSGAFGLIVVDFARGVRMPIAAQTRLAGLAKKHGTALICLTEKETTESSLGSLVSLRAQISRLQVPSAGHERMRTPAPDTAHGEKWRCRARIIKDKQRGPGWEHAESFSGPPGLS